MAGSLRCREPGVWELRVYLGRDPLTSKKTYVSQSFRGTKRAAGVALAQLVAARSREPRQGTNAATVGELIASHLGNIEIEATTRSDYESIYRAHIAPALGTRPLAKLTTNDLDRFYRALTKPVAEGGKGLSASRVRHAHALFSGALKQAVRWGWIPRNPARDATLPKVRNKRVSPPSSTEAARALSSAQQVDPAFASLLHVAIATGARRGELCGLRVSDLDAEQRRLAIRESVADVRGTLHVKATKTHAERTIAVDDATVAAIVKHLGAGAARAKKAGVALVDDPFMFTSSLDGSKPMPPQRVTDLWREIRSTAGLERTRFHDLRHLQATSLLNAGVPVRTVASRLGHATPSMTLNVYAHALPEADRAAADLLGELYGQDPM